MGSSRSVAVAQTCPAAGDVAANTAEHVRLARIAADEGAAVVVFPELSLTGYELGLPGGLAFCEGDHRLAPLIDTAVAHGVTLVVGAPVRLGEALHIGAFIIRPDWTTEVYTKHRLGAFPPGAACDSRTGAVPPAKAAVFRPGDRDPLVRLGTYVAAVAVCADIGNPAHPERAAGRGADIYLAGMFVIPSDFDGDALRLSRYAEQHHMMTAFANFGGPSGGLRSAGRSSIWSDAGELLVRLWESGSGVGAVTETDHGPRSRVVVADGPATG
jgi:predicted amidohydrolase